MHDLEVALLGDYLRGGIALAIMRWNANGCSNSTSAAPHRKFLDPAQSRSVVAEAIDEFFDERASQIYSWMDRLRMQVGRACTNLLPHESRILPPAQGHAGTRCAWNPAILSTAQDTKSRIAGAQQMAVLMRCPRRRLSLLCRPPSLHLFGHRVSRVLPIWDRRVAVFLPQPGRWAALCERFPF